MFVLCPCIVDCFRHAVILFYNEHNHVYCRYDTLALAFFDYHLAGHGSTNLKHRAAGFLPHCRIGDLESEIAERMLHGRSFGSRRPHEEEDLGSVGGRVLTSAWLGGHQPYHACESHEPDISTDSERGLASGFLII